MAEELIRKQEFGVDYMMLGRIECNRKISMADEFIMTQKFEPLDSLVVLDVTGKFVWLKYS